MNIVADLHLAFGQVWSPPTFVVAIVAGLIFGYVVVGRLASDPTYADEGLTPHRVGYIVSWTFVAGGAVFYVGQAVASFADGDLGWPRVVARYGLWIVYSVALGLGTWLRLRWHLSAMHRRAQAHARIAVEGPPANGHRVEDIDARRRADGDQ